jgi:NTE family protein
VVRLNEAGLLSRLGRVSSVSGGSITAAVLALNWSLLKADSNGVFQNLNLVIAAVRGCASITIDAGAAIEGLLLPGTVNDRVVEAYDKHIFHGKTLQDLPDPSAGAPCFVINATNVQTSSLWRFERAYMGDWQVGLVDKPTVSMAAAVAASSAFPPVLSPAVLENTQPMRAVKGAALGRPPFTTDIVLCDGGVYDNLGLENPWKSSKTILVSDAGAKIAPEENPAHDWIRHAYRINDIIDNQVRGLRKKYLIESYQSGSRDGAYWGIRTDWQNYKLPADPLGCKNRNPNYLASIPTRLKSLEDDVQKKLINWGYAVCDAALRAHFVESLKKRYSVLIQEPRAFPYPEAGY